MANKLVQYLKDSKEELRKVSWPTKRITWKQTLVVLGMSIGVAVFLGVLDYVFNLGLEQVI